MASLKDMRVRIAATKATQKITKAMQMVAASKLRRAQAAAEAARPYAERMGAIAGNIAAGMAGSGYWRRSCWPAPARDKVHLLLVCTGERGLCRRRSTPRSLRRRARAREPAAGRRQDRSRSSPSAARATSSFAAITISYIVEHVELRAVRQHRLRQCRGHRQEGDRAATSAGEFDVCHAVLFALQVGDRADPDRRAAHSAGVRGRRRRSRRARRLYEYEPERGRNSRATFCRAISSTQIFRALLENNASFYGAQMSRDGQRDAQRRRHDQQADHHL